MVLASPVISQSPPLIKIPRARLLHSCKTGKRLYLHLKEKKKNLKLEVAKRNVLKKEIGEKFLSPFCTWEIIFLFLICFLLLHPFPIFPVSPYFLYTRYEWDGWFRCCPGGQLCNDDTPGDTWGETVCDNDMKASAHISQGHCDKCDTLTPLNTAYTHMYILNHIYDRRDEWYKWDTQWAYASPTRDLSEVGEVLAHPSRYEDTNAQILWGDLWDKNEIGTSKSLVCG